MTCQICQKGLKSIIERVARKHFDCVLKVKKQVRFNRHIDIARQTIRV